MSNDKEFNEDQNFFELKNHHLKKLHGNKNLFVDKKFSNITTSIYYSKNDINGITWKRVPEIAKDKNPCLILDGAKANDVAQGRLGIT